MFQQTLKTGMPMKAKVATTITLEMDLVAATWLAALLGSIDTSTGVGMSEAPYRRISDDLEAARVYADDEGFETLRFRSSPDGQSFVIYREHAK